MIDLNRDVLKEYAMKCKSLLASAVISCLLILGSTLPGFGAQHV